MCSEVQEKKDKLREKDEIVKNSTTSVVVQWLRSPPADAGDMGSIPVQEYLHVQQILSLSHYH